MEAFCIPELETEWFTVGFSLSCFFLLDRGGLACWPAWSITADGRETAQVAGSVSRTQLQGRFFPKCCWAIDGNWSLLGAGKRKGNSEKGREKGSTGHGTSISRRMGKQLWILVLSLGRHGHGCWSSMLALGKRGIREPVAQKGIMVNYLAHVLVNQRME
jgi:hypothetical protein